MYCIDIDKSPLQRQESLSMTQGEYRRICAVLFLLSRRLINDTVFILKKVEKKSRIQPRHILTAAILGNIIPRRMVDES